MKRIILLIFFLISFVNHAQEKKAFQIYNKQGNKVSYGKLLKALTKVDILLFGEYHNNSIVHWLQLELAKDISKIREIIIGAEMIESDNQHQLNQYLNDEINQKQFDSTARLWNNYKTDYKPIVDFSKGEKIKVVATNIPRRYASIVSKKGFEGLQTLTPEEKKWIVPLPILYDSNLPGYSNMIKMMGDHTNPNMPKAQAIKDATMAYFIVKNKKNNALFFHLNGSYHSDNFEGIYWYLKIEADSLKITTIATVEQSDLNKLLKENYNKADYILVIDEDATKTY